MVINTTNITSANNLLELTVGVNNASGGLYSVTLVFLVFIMFLVVFRREGNNAFMISSMVTFAFSIMLFGVGLVGFWVLGVMSALLLVGIMMSIFSK